MGETVELEPADRPEADHQPDGADRSEKGGVKPWTIKGIPPEIRNAAISAADRDGVTIGEWIGRAILETIKGDRQRGRGAPVVVPQAAAPVADPAAELSSIERMVALAAQLAQATGEPPPKGLSRTAYGLLSDRLRALKKAAAQ